MAKRIQEELKKLYEDMPKGVIKAEPVSDNDLFHWELRIQGPDGTPYEGGEFELTCEYPSDFPFHPPKILFVTKIYHPNVNSTGTICLDVLKDQWSPELGMGFVFSEILDLLAHPNPDHPLAPEIATAYKNDKAAFEKQAKEWTEQYAKKKDDDDEDEN